MQIIHSIPVRIRPLARKQRRDLFGLSGIAVVLLIVAQIWFGRESAGLDVLLVLSGFFFGARVLRRIDTSDTLLRAELGWLLRRLAPALVAVLAVSSVLTLLIQPQTRWEAFTEQVLASLGFYQNWLLVTTAGDYVQASETVTPLQHLWAVSAAGQFFVAFLALAWVLTALTRRGVRRTRRNLLIALTAVAMIASLTYAVTEHATNPTLAYYSSATRAWEPLAGVLAAAAVTRLTWPRWLRLVTISAGLAAILAASVFIDGAAAYPGPWALVPVIATVLIILAGAQDGAGPLSAPALVALGALAYSLYLWHWPMLIFLLAHTNNDTVGVGEAAGVTAATVAAAYLTWRLVEVRSTQPSWQPVLSGSVTAILVLLLVVTSLGWRDHVDLARTNGTELTTLSLRDYPGARAIIEHSKVARLPVRPTGLEASDDLPPATIDKCLADFGGETVIGCVYGDPTASRTIALAGGSHSEHWLTALHTLGRQHGFRVTTYLKMGCPLTTAAVPVIAGAFKPYPSCRTWSDNALAQIIADRPDYVFFTTTRPILNGPGDYVPDYYLGIWEELAANGIAMLGIRDTPWMVRDGRFFSPVDCLAAGDDADTCGLPRDEALTARNPTLDHLPDYPSMRLLDLSDAVCGPRICRAVEGNVLIYHDAHHLSGTYVRTLADELGRQLADATGWW